MAKDKTTTEKVDTVTTPTGTKNSEVKSVINKKDVRKAYQENVVSDKENNLPMFVAWKKLYKELCLSDEEAREFLGGRDPKDYFREGLIHTSFLKNFDNLLPEDEEEVITLRKVIPFKDVLLFKKKRTNVYILLIPKRLARFEMDEIDNEFTNEHINYDISAIAFTGNGTPSAYEEGYFIQQLKKVLSHLEKVATQRKFFE